MTKQEKQTAVKVMQDMRMRLQRDRQQLIDVMINTGTESHDANTFHIQEAIDSLASASHSLKSFIESPTGQRWEGK